MQGNFTLIVAHALKFSFKHEIKKGNGQIFLSSYPKSILSTPFNHSTLMKCYYVTQSHYSAYQNIMKNIKTANIKIQAKTILLHKGTFAKAYISE